MKTPTNDDPVFGIQCFACRAAMPVRNSQVGTVVTCPHCGDTHVMQSMKMTAKSVAFFALVGLPFIACAKAWQLAFLLPAHIIEGICKAFRETFRGDSR